MGHAAAASKASAGRDIAPGTLTFRGQYSPAPTTGLLAESWMVPFENSLPIWRPAAFKGQHNFAGLWWCATNQRHVGFESWCERDNLMSLDFDPNVTGIASQPFLIAMPASLPQRSHVPDYFIRLADGTAIVIDVRPDGRVTPRDQEVFQATEDLCATVGSAYRRLGGLPPVFLVNLRWLAGYLHHRNGGSISSLSHLIREAAIMAILTGPEEIDRDLLDEINLDHAAESIAPRPPATNHSIQ